MATGTKQALGQALLELCEEIPFEKISVQKLAQKVGINRQTFYYHFTDKYQLLCWFYHQDVLHYLESEKLSLDNWEEQTLKMLQAIKEKKVFYRNTVLSHREILMTEFSKIIQQRFVALFENMDDDQELSAEDKHFYARFFAYGCSGMLADWILEDFKESPLEISVQLFRLAKDTEFFSYRLYTKEQLNDMWRLK